jgi:organic radical activating enzyme
MLRDLPPARLVETFESLQGEGAHAGTPAVFVRFSKCSAACEWCDTPYEEVNEVLPPSELLARCLEYKSRYVIFTGGEPSIQLTKEIVTAFRRSGFKTAIETNGAHDVSDLGLDWITVSPKMHVPGGTKRWVQRAGHELKVVWDRDTAEADVVEYGLKGAFGLKYVSPEWGARESTLPRCVAFCLENPSWKLTSQSHKLWNVR